MAFFIYWHQVSMKPESLKVVKAHYDFIQWKKKDANVGQPIWYHN